MNLFPTSGTPATFDYPIDGEAFPVWQFQIRMRITTAGPATLLLQPNGVSTGLTAVRNQNGVITAPTAWELLRTDNTSRRPTVWGTVYTRKGRARAFLSQGLRGGLEFNLAGGQWSDTTTPITFFRILCNGGELLEGNSGNHVQFWPAKYSWPVP
jgi:hypothetical protein